MNKEEDCACVREMTAAIIVRGFLNFISKYDRWKDEFWFLLLRTKRQRFQSIRNSKPTKIIHDSVNSFRIVKLVNSK